MSHKKSKSKVGIIAILLVAIFLFPSILIFILNAAIICFTIKTTSTIPLLMLFDLNTGTSVSDYITAYIGILGIEITAMLTWAIFRLSTSRESQEKNEKIKICRNKVYNDLVNALEYLFELYLKQISSSYEVLPKYILIDKDWEDRITNLDLDKQYVEIYRELYSEISNIKLLIENEKDTSRHLDELFKKITQEFYHYYHTGIGVDIHFCSVLGKKYLEAIDELIADGMPFKDLVGKYRSGDILYTKQNNIFTVYEKDNKKHCQCSFINNKPSTGWAKLHYQRSNKVFYEGKIENGVEIEGIFFDCSLDADEKPVTTVEGKPLLKPNFIDRETVDRHRLANGNDCVVANFAYKDKQFTIVKGSIRQGKNIT
ncbi:MAG: hypothetical protein K0S61_555 [Anaerocolumna sp.]|jgi:hypothetical protein|nr:hypothetical protein [Anaerocolumna sp.]